MDSFIKTQSTVQAAGATLDGESIPVSEVVESASPRWQLKELKGKHKTICSLTAQGVPRQQIAIICEVTPEYVSMLLRQPLCMQYIARMNEAVDVQLEALHGASVDAIARVLTSGNDEDSLKAARLQMEATGRVGPKVQQTAGVEQTDKLDKLADRLLGLLDKQRGRILDGTATEVGRLERGGCGADPLSEEDCNGLPASAASQHGLTVPEERGSDSEQQP